MTRFTAPDLARLPALPLGTDTDEAIRLARVAELSDRLVANGFAFDVGMLRTDPMVVANAEAGAARELLALTRRDDAIRAVLLATSWGPFLDALGATQVPPVIRKTLIAADPVTGAAAVMELDDDYRRRIQLAPEELSTCGPEGAYLSFALGVEGVKMASPYGPMSFGGDYDHPFTDLGCVNIPIVASVGDGSASPQLVAAVQAGLSAKERRPLADFVTVSAATIVPYEIEAVLYVGEGADRDVIVQEAARRLLAQALRQHRPAAAQPRRMLFAQCAVPDAGGTNLVEDVNLISPAADVNADPITPASPAGAYRAPFCTAITVRAEVVDD